MVSGGLGLFQVCSVVLLPIQEIVRHPNFNTKRGGGPINGSHIAIFKVDDIGIDKYKAS